MVNASGMLGSTIPMLELFVLLVLAGILAVIGIAIYAGIREFKKE